MKPPQHRVVLMTAAVAAGLISTILATYLAVTSSRKKKRIGGIKQKQEQPQEEIKRDLAHQSPPLTVVPRQVLQLHTLRQLNLMGNALVSLPTEIGELTQLQILGLKDNHLTALPDTIGNLTALVALYVTNNKLTHFPPSIGQLVNLRKFQASFNALQALPEEMADMRSLELFRAAGNPDLHSIPSALAMAPALTWLSLGGSKFCAAFSRNDPASEEEEEGHNAAWWLASSSSSNDNRRSSSSNSSSSSSSPPLITRQSMTLVQKLGDGASGEVFLSQWHPIAASPSSSPSSSSSSFFSLKKKLTPEKLKKKKEKKEEVQHVAVKIFRDDTSPDGRAIDELEVLCLLEHPNLSKVRALLIDDDLNDSDNPPSLPPSRPRPRPPVGVVMDLITGQPLAAKPDHTSVLRCRWEGEKTYPLRVVLRMAQDLTGALTHLHEKKICHGDVYAHNCVVDEEGNTTLLDYGASFLYGGREGGREGGVDFERLEVRAFGLLLRDLVERLGEEGGREEGEEEGEEGWKDLRTIAAAGKTKKRRSSSPLFGSLSLSQSSSSAATAAAVAAAAAAALTPAAARALLEGVVQHCLLPTVAERPTFAALHARLSSLVVSGGGGR
jgi:hypothetical protein